MNAKKTMDRNEFFSAIGVSAAALTVMSCLGCGKSSNSANGPSTSAPNGVDFTLNLTASANSTLTTNGGYLLSHNILVARTSAGAYIAVQESCTHESYPLVYQSGNSRFYCNNHGATFTEKGVVTGGPTNRSLAVYDTAYQAHYYGYILKRLRHETNTCYNTICFCNAYNQLVGRF